MTTTSNGLGPQAKERVLKTVGQVGFDSLPDQLVNKVVAQGFTFNILCIGMVLFISLTLFCLTF